MLGHQVVAIFRCCIDIPGYQAGNLGDFLARFGRGGLQCTQVTVDYLGQSDAMATGVLLGSLDVITRKSNRELCSFSFHSGDGTADLSALYGNQGSRFRNKRLDSFEFPVSGSRFGGSGLLGS